VEDDSILVRLYETEHRNVKTSLRFGFPVGSAAEVDLIEENPLPKAVVKDTVQIEFKPFEIKTIKVSLK
jgi:alpha-mannosidase